MFRATTVVMAGLVATWVGSSVAFGEGAASGVVSYSAPRSVYEATVNLAADETLRIQQHLDFVAEHLQAQDVSHLDGAQRTARGQCIELLGAYRDAGCFPRNTSFPGLQPIFIDDRGTACAVAHLMIATGAGDVAESVAQMQNLAYVPEIRDGRVGEWAQRSGLTLEECALIQPAYGSCPPLGSFTCADQGGDVLLSWTLAFEHQSVYLERDGQFLGMVLATEGFTYVDVAPPPGLHTYRAYGDCGIASMLLPMTCTHDVAAAEFRRGDCNGDGSINLADAVHCLSVLFLTPSTTPDCIDACDGNDDGALNLADAVRMLNALFAAEPLPGPYPLCGADPSADAMTCALGAACP